MELLNGYSKVSQEAMAIVQVGDFYLDLSNMVKMERRLIWKWLFRRQNEQDLEVN